MHQYDSEILIYVPFLARLYVIYRKSANYLKNCAALIAALLTIDVCNIDLVLFCSSQLKTETLRPLATIYGNLP